MSKLQGKRALVTAGAQGIGLVITRQLLAAGCDVLVHYRRSADVARAAVYLASEYDGFITGATLEINGGVYGC